MTEKTGIGAKGLAHIGVFVKDMEKSLDFYKNTLGFDFYYQKEITADGTAITLSFLRQGSCEIELIGKPGYKSSSNGVVAHIAILVDDIDFAVKKLKEKGVKMDALPAKLDLFGNGIKNIFFSGPDGESLELVEVL
jgi:lactoylglutathione lyase